jgi:glycosyltransferase involved in cell wall biosynthesis
LADFGLVIPTRNRAEFATRIVDAVKGQTAFPARWIVIDCESSDGTADIYRAAGASVHVIPAASFDHGGTRQLGVELCKDAEFILYLVDDAVPNDFDCFKLILEAFEDPKVGAAYGRQLPPPDVDAIAAHSRLFNYPEQDRLQRRTKGKQQTFKTVFCSDAFAAYRKSALEAAGGFPRPLSFGEDTVLAARLLEDGWQIAYRAKAQVIHANVLSVVADVRRAFDTGALHAQYESLFRPYAVPEREGFRFLISQIGYLATHAPWRIAEALLRTVAKAIAYRLGRFESRLPVAMKRRLSGNPKYRNCG